MPSDHSDWSNVLFRLTAAAGFVFVLTVLAMLTADVGHSRSPLAIFLEKYAAVLIAGEVALTLLIGLAAMIVDRRQTVRQMHTAQQDQQNLPDDERRSDSADEEPTADS